MLTFTESIGGGQVALTFSDKPSAEIRGILKSAGFRWSPSGGYWWRRQIAGAADFIATLRRRIDQEAGIRRPDGDCHKCGCADGFVRSYAARTFLHCDSCWLEWRKANDFDYRAPAEAAALDVDRLYEDDCARRCGL